jgi:hypothetical protein
MTRLEKIESIKRQGAEAYHDGAMINHNPYNEKPHSTNVAMEGDPPMFVVCEVWLYRAWRDGYTEAREGRRA